jgi:TolB-like protein/Flp pilus assembly protein TadD
MKATRLNPVSSKLSAIMIADIVGFSRLVDKNESGNIDRVSRSIRLFRDLIEDYGGEVINIAGDGIFALFDSAARAIRFAAEFQRELKNEVVWNEDDERIAFRIGINLGETTPTADGVYGHCVNVAARVQTLAEPGGICITDLAKRAVHDWSSLALRPLGKKVLKNIDEPVEVFAVEIKEGSDRAKAVTPREPIRERSEKIENASVAILPLVNLTGELTDRHLCEGITSDIISGLSRFRDLIVIARNSVEPFGNRDIAAGEIGRKLGVHYLLDGSLQRSNSQLRIRVQLNQAESGNMIWSERYDGQLTDIFAFQDDITEQITSLLAVQINTAERRRTQAQQTPDLQAYGLILRGQDLVTRFVRESNLHARRLFEQAVELAPTYSRGYAALSRTFNLDWRYAWADDRDAALNRAEELASTAIGYDDSDARGFAELGYALLYKKQHEECLAAYERALQLNPNDADLLAEMGDALGYCRQSDRAIELLKKAIRLNPYHPDWYLWYLGDVYFFRGEYEKVIETLFAMRDKSEGHRLLASSFAHLGQLDEARKHAGLLLEKHPNFSIEKWRTVPPNKFPEDNEIFVEGLKMAGLK